MAIINNVTSHELGARCGSCFPAADDSCSTILSDVETCLSFNLPLPTPHNMVTVAEAYGRSRICPGGYVCAAHPLQNGKAAFCFPFRAIGLINLPAPREDSECSKARLGWLDEGKNKLDKLTKASLDGLTARLNWSGWDHLG